ncbi:DNA polymerase IV [Microbacterium oryzae]|uniref:DNA polymerase IV n=1 Tax=Microbacterium oryzae TaxID=743009 RepID=UPI0025AF432C|nr:DNA polymerase IV [Microbacterium oryzae]MDN3309488.1 DNA polymerase IV [Microbacterium oryzae]
MGRADGTGRIVSAEGADDSGTGILHVDMDAFYAAVEILDDPSLAGKPLIIGAPDGRSVVSSASYEARRYGVRSAMPVSQAVRLCPHALIVPPHFDRYRAVSAQVMAIFRDFTPLVEQLSIDEAFLDVRGARRLWGTPAEIARMIRARVHAEAGITCSVGVAASKHVAKMASTICKPDGMLVVPGARTLEFLGARPVRAMWGVGPKAAEVLESRGIRTIADLRETPLPVLTRAVGAASAQRLHALSRGEDSREVETHRVEKSVSHEETFQTDVDDVVLLRAELLRLSDRVAVRLRRGGLEAAGVAIKVRFSDFTTLTRSQTLAEPTALGQRIGDVARDLLAGVELRQAVRLIGVRAERLREAGSSALALWDEDADWKRVEGTLDDAVSRFGDGVVMRAAFLGRTERHPQVPRTPRPAEDSD